LFYKLLHISDQDIKRLIDLAKEKLKAGITKEQALQSFIDAGIMNDKGEFTKPYAILESVIKNV
jgi:hypothetical protein